jgi:RNA polymerase primary sigma factor
MTVPKRDVLKARARQLCEARIRFVRHPSFDDPAIAARILGALLGQDGSRCALDGQPAGEFRRSSDERAARPLLTPDEETHLFRKMNYLKYAAVLLREELDADEPAASIVDRIEAFVREAAAILNRIIRANQGLVVSIVRKFAGAGRDFFDLVSDGNISLLRAAERFDFARGIRFSTYATYAISRDFSRTIRREHIRRSRFLTGRPDLFPLVADHRGEDGPAGTREELTALEIGSLLGHLAERERMIIVRRFGLTENKWTLTQLGRELGISKERVRQIESNALRKLREKALAQRLDLPIE